MYAKIFKRFLDFWLSLFALFILSPLLLVLTVVGAVAMRGNPFFVQLRPGRIDRITGKERIFKLIKFRTMSNAKGKDGELLPDEKRLNAYGCALRATSLDELPELLCILKGDMSIVGPRPQLIRDMVFMSDRQRRRHCVRPGLTGLAQINGRNNITWEQKFEYDLRYVEKITFSGDMRIIFQTVGAVLMHSDIVRDGTASDVDFGDWLMLENKVTKAEYEEKQAEAKSLLRMQSSR